MSIIAAVVALLVALLFTFDEQISRAAVQEPAAVRVFLGVATDVGLSAWYIYPTLALLCLAAISNWDSLHPGRRSEAIRFYWHAAFLCAAVLGAQAVTQILKFAFGRARPHLIETSGVFDFTIFNSAYDFASFPSGHATTMGAVTAALMIWAPTARWPILILGLALAATRIVVRAHYPSDVVAGFGIGLLFALALARWLARKHIAYRLGPRDGVLGGLFPARVTARRGGRLSLLRELSRGIRSRP